MFWNLNMEIDKYSYSWIKIDFQMIDAYQSRSALLQNGG